jgi:hypothetical protein
MSKKLVSFCGYRCDLCPAYVKNVDRLAKRRTIRKGWNTFFGFDVPEERIICIGCDSTGNHLDTECLVRPCARSKHLQNCSFCDLFESCETLQTRADILDKKKRNTSIRFQKRSINYSFVRMKGETN